MKITAAVLRSPDGSYAIDEVDLGDPRADEVLVQIVGAGICHTDVAGRALGSLPIITGHEGSGVVEAVGAAVHGIAVGDHVVLSFDSCGTCANCNRQLPSHCDTLGLRNMVGRRVDGTTAVRDASGTEVSSRWFAQSSFATHALATARNTVVVDHNLPLEKLGPLGCGIQTGAATVLVALNVQPGQSLGVFGAGAVGLAAVMAARVAGASSIIAVDLHRHRLELGAELGATHVLDGTSDDLLAQIQTLTGGGTDFAIDTTGVPAVMTTALGCVRMAGTCAFVGIQTGDLVLDGLALVGKTAIGILSGSANPHTFIPRMINLWQEGRFPFDRLIQEFPLAQINEAEHASLSGQVIKPVLLPAQG